VWNGKTIAVVLPTYNERESIAQVIREFEALGIVDDLVVVNNNAAEGTSDEVAGTTAREVHEPTQGYGAAIKRGLRETTSDLVAVCEPDGTFVASDLFKLLAFSGECEAVFGSRTVDVFIWDGANMGWFLRWGNWAVGKLLEVVFNTAHVSDVGCTFRLLRRSAVDTIAPFARSDGSFYGLEMMILVIIGRLKFVQIPVNYRERVGVSSVTGDVRKAWVLGLQMIRTILWYRLHWTRATGELAARRRASSGRLGLR
jgi:glycosyltransferase involved in cell wall biosynthesis